MPKSPTSTSVRTDPVSTAICDPCRETKRLATLSSVFERASILRRVRLLGYRADAMPVAAS
jgi:hypothetical protein